MFGRHGAQRGNNMANKVEDTLRVKVGDLDEVKDQVGEKGVEGVTTKTQFEHRN